MGSVRAAQVIALLLLGTMLVGSAKPANTDYPDAESEPALSSNFTQSDSESNGLMIRWIVIHDVEGNAQAAINWFKDSRARASSHYVIDYQGNIYQMVREKDIAWHAGNWVYNEHSIGIENAGYADQDLFTEEEYSASAKLVAYLVRKYNISLNHPMGLAPADPSKRSGIIGHDQVPDPSNADLGGGASHHYDPGRNWNWTRYMKLVRYYSEGESGDYLASGSEEGNMLTWILGLPVSIFLSVISFVVLFIILIVSIRFKPPSGNHVLQRMGWWGLSEKKRLTSRQIAAWATPRSSGLHAGGRSDTGALEVTSPPQLSRQPR